MKILVILATVAIIAFTIYAIANKIKNDKLISVILFIAMIAMISIFTNNQKSIEKKHAKIINLFNRNKDITCDGIKINNKSFNFVSGTLVFVGQDTSDFKGQIIPLDKCELPK